MSWLNARAAPAAASLWTPGALRLGAGWSQAVVIGVPGEESESYVGSLARERIFPVRYDTESLPFPWWA